MRILHDEASSFISQSQRFGLQIVRLQNLFGLLDYLYLNFFKIILLHEPHHEKTCFYICKKGHKSVVQSFRPSS